MSYVPTQPQTKRRRRQRLFTKEIEQLLFALGDPGYGQEATVNALDDALVDFLTDLSHNSLMYARLHGRNKVKMDDFSFALRQDPMKLGRIEYIVKLSQRIEQARKMYDEKNLAQQAMREQVEPVVKKKRGRKKKSELLELRRQEQEEQEREDSDDDA